MVSRIIVSTFLYCLVVTAQISWAQNPEIPALPRKLTEFQLRFAAYMETVVDQGDESTPIIDRLSIYISTFNPLNFGVDPKYYLRSPGRELNTTAWPLVELDRTAVWPNNPDPMPAGVVGVSGIVWTSGFLVPLKNKGKLELYDTTVSPPSGPVNIAALDTTPWSYHRVLWKDIDGDGDLDALSARFNAPLTGGTKKELVWLENPGETFYNLSSGGWAQHLIIGDGPDVHIRNTKLMAGGIEFDCIVAAEFWNEKLVLYYTPNGDWTDVSQIVKVDIDVELGRTFDLYLDDFNMDGRLDIVVTAYNYTFGNVFAFEIPEDFRAEPFVKHTLADGFVPNDVAAGDSMTPGGLQTFYPYDDYKFDENGEQRKPYIMLSGDDDGCHYILEPESEDPTNWAYTKHLLVDTGKATSGKFSVRDLDGDGYTEIVAAGYSANTIYVYTYKPEEQN